MKWPSLVALTLAVLMPGCAQSPKDDKPFGASGKPSSERTSPVVLLPTPLADLSRMATPVQEQLRAEYDRLSSATGNPATSKSDLASAYGAMGTLFLAADE